MGFGHYGGVEIRLTDLKLARGLTQLSIKISGDYGNDY
jgi:hypothetical protein